MKVILALIIFCIVLFLYLHLQYHLKTSDDLEVYTIDNPSKDKLEEICDLRQPVTFEYNIDNDKLDKEKIISSFGAFDLKIRDCQDVDNYSLPVSYKVALKLFSDDTNKRYFTENNLEFLKETGLIKIIQYHDAFLRPPMVSNCYYDLLYGSNETTTSFRYELNYRTYFYVKKGYIQLKLAPPKYSKYLYTSKDYNNFEFKSLINPWNVSPQYRQDFDKIKCLDMKIHENAIIYIPAYWWYSIKFNSDSELISMKYRTYMNNLAISPHILISLLQKQNNKNSLVKKLTHVEPLIQSPNENLPNVESTSSKETNEKNKKLNEENM
tara:strand:- start:4674 stop:5645 length:972 start_codon:yes stop_codon:yes gene_type:complete